ncbi:MAG: hypothetical protein U1E65_27305 [Myxococcota bacterium]
MRALALFGVLLVSTPAFAEGPPSEETETPEEVLGHLLEELNSVQSTLTSTVEFEPSELEFSDEEPEPPRPVEPAKPVPKERVVNLVFSGAGGGLGAERFVFQLHHRLPALLTEEKLTAARVIHGVLIQAGHALVSPDGKIATLLSFLDGTPVYCDDARRVTAVTENGERLIDPGVPPGAPGEGLAKKLLRSDPHLHTQSLDARRCKNASQVEVILYSPPGHRLAELDWSLGHFEFARALRLQLERDGKAEELDVLGFPKNDAARRFRLLDSARRSNEPTLVVDAGSFVDGTSRGRGRLSMLRPLAFEMLTRLHPSALVPGESELIDGAAQFLKEAKVAKLAYLATNWSAQDPALALPRSIEVRIRTAEGAVRIAFLGLLDPALSVSIPKLVEEEVELTDPVEAAQHEVARLRAQSPPPDAIVVLTTATPALIETLRSELVDVDAIIGSGTPSDARVERSSVELLSPSESSRAGAWIPLSGVGRASLRFSPRGRPSRLIGISTAYARSRLTVEPDPRVVELLARSRRELYPRLDRPLIAAFPGDPLRAISEEEWRRLVCEAVHARTQADVVMLPALPSIDPTPGPLSEIAVSERLSVLDHLAVASLAGEDLLDLLRDPPEYTPLVCGAQTKRTSPKVDGRAIAKGQSYRIVTTDRALLLGLKERLEDGADGDLLALGGVENLEEGGEPVSLREAVLSTLRERRAPEAVAIASLLDHDAAPLPPAWMLLIDGLSLRLERFQGAEASAFSSVPDAQVTAPSSLSLGAAVDARLTYDDPALGAELRTRLRYQRLALGGQEAKETDDAIRLAIAASLPGFDFAIGPARWMPYGELALDTEFTAGSGAADDPTTDRRAEFSAALGLSLKDGPLDRLRVGAFVLRDFARAGGPTKLGPRLDAELTASPGPLRLSAHLESSLYLPSASENQTDLRFRALLEAKVGLHVARYLIFSLLLQGLAFSGAVEATQAPQLSLRFGASIDVGGAFRL